MSANAVTGTGCMSVEYTMEKVDGGIEFDVSDNYACLGCVVPHDTWMDIVMTLEGLRFVHEKWNVTCKSGKTNIEFSISDEGSDCVDDSCSVMLYNGSVASWFHVNVDSFIRDMRRAIE